MFDIYHDDIEMDIYRNEYKITGSLNVLYKTIPPLPEEFLEYYDKALVYDVMFTKPRRKASSFRAGMDRQEIRLFNILYNYYLKNI